MPDANNQRPETSRQDARSVWRTEGNFAYESIPQVLAWCNSIIVAANAALQAGLDRDRGPYKSHSLATEHHNVVSHEK